MGAETLKHAEESQRQHLSGACALNVHLPVAQRLFLQVVWLEEPPPNPHKPFIHQTSAAVKRSERTGEKEKHSFNTSLFPLTHYIHEYD